jgi:hypothetical protein
MPLVNEFSPLFHFAAAEFQKLRQIRSPHCLAPFAFPHLQRMVIDHSGVHVFRRIVGETSRNCHSDQISPSGTI